MKNETRRKSKRSQLPYKVASCSIGERLKAKAEIGDIHASKVLKVFTERGDLNAKRNDNIRSGK